MADKDQQHLRIRLSGDLLGRIDAAREKTGRTRTDEIEMRLLESFMRTDIQLVAEMAVHNVLTRVARLEKARKEPIDIYDALFHQAKDEVARVRPAKAPAGMMALSNLGKTSKRSKK